MKAVHNPLRRAIADLSHNFSRTVVGHGSVDLAARWDRQPEVVKPAAAEWLGYQLDDPPVGELALGE